MSKIEVVKIVKKSIILAEDLSGELHEIENYNGVTEMTEVIQENVKGIVTKTWENVKYSDGTFSRDVQEITKFKITKK